MFDPDREKGCPGCTGFVADLGNLSLVHERDTTFVLASRAPLAKLEAYQKIKGWDVPWVSSFGSDFNYDFHATLDAAVCPPEDNFRRLDEEPHQEHDNSSGEAHGISAFFRDVDGVFHTYSAYARGVENLTTAYSLLDITPYGRQEDFEDSLPGWPQRPTYG